MTVVVPNGRTSEAKLAGESIGLSMCTFESMRLGRSTAPFASKVSFFGFRTEPVDEAVFNKYCLRIERSREDVEHAGVENGKVMDLRLRALLGVLYENFWMQSF